MTLGDRLTYFREKAGISRAELTQAVGCGGNMLYLYEKKGVQMGVFTAIEIAGALGVSLDRLVGIDDRDNKDIQRWLQEKTEWI